MKSSCLAGDQVVNSDTWSVTLAEAGVQAGLGNDSSVYLDSGFRRNDGHRGRYPIAVHNLSRRLYDTGYGVFSSCAYSDTRSSSICQRNSSKRGSIMPAFFC